MHFGVPVPPAGEVGQEKVDDTPCRFLNALLLLASAPPSLIDFFMSEEGR